MLGKRIINTATGAGAACTTDTVQILGDTSCVAYYKMNDATDETGSYDGTASNVNFNVAGKFGNAGEFNGSSSYVNTTFTVPAISTYSASLWFKTSATGINQCIFSDSNSNGQDNSTRLSVIITNTNTFGISLGNGSTSYYNGNASAISYLNNAWHNLVITYSGTTIKLYINNSLIVTYTSTVSAGTLGTQTLKIGRLGDYSGFYFNGSIDQVRIFDRAITSNEVETLYNEVQCIPTIVPTDHFEPVLYTGNEVSGRQITNIGFQPDFVWIKDRGDSTHWHNLFDSVRGASERLFSNATNAESFYNESLQSFDADGFTVGLDPDVNRSGGGIVAWNWKAGGAAVSNTDGTITSQVSANTDAGFSIVKYTGSSTSGLDIGHGLSSTPEMVILKNLDSSHNWYIYHKDTGTTSGYINFLRFDATTGTYSDMIFYPVDFNNSTFIAGHDTVLQGNMIAYCFHSVEGYSKVGSYTGTGASNSIVTGFRPAFVMIKRTDSTGSWEMIDNKRSPENVRDRVLFANLSNAEQQGDTLGYYPTNFLSNGFELLQGSNGYNANGGSYIFMAFAEENVQPEPELANSFNVVTYTGSSTVTGLGFQPDLVWIKARGLSQAPNIFDSIRGGELLRTSSTAASGGDYIDYIDDGFQFKVTDAGWNQSGQNYVAWCWKASNDSTINNEGSITSVVSANPAAGFSIVKWAGNNTAGATVGHGLSSAPEMIIIKNYSQSIGQRWVIGHNNMASSSPWNYYLEFDTGARAVNNSRSFNGTAPTSSVFSVGNDTQVNDDDMIAYCFHSVDSYQKVGSYTGTTAAKQVDVGFQPRFVMIKNSSRAGEHWFIADSARTGDPSPVLKPNVSNAEQINSSTDIDFYTDGFSLDNTATAAAGLNENGDTYIYLAIA